MEQVVVRRSKSIMTIAFVLSLCFLLCSLFLAIKLLPTMEFSGFVLIAMFLGFSGACLGISYRQMMSSAPGIVISHDGFSVDLASVVIDKIFWADIVKISHWQGRGKATLLVYVKDPQKYTSQFRGIGRMIAAGNQALAGAPIFLSTLLLEMNGAELQKLLEQRLELFRQSLQ